VRENLAYGLKARRDRNARQKVDTLAERLDMQDMLTLRPANLSSGQKQRVALARALIRNPPVLLLDEPLSHLDAAQRQRVRRELKLLQREFGYTTIVVTHDQLEALSLADRMAVMDAGVIQQFGTPDEPKINLVEGVVERRDQGTLVRVGQDGLLPTTATTPRDGQPVVVGLRPQDCLTDVAPEAPSVSGEVRVFEHLLESGLATLSVPGLDESVVVQTPAEESWQRQDRVRLSAPAERVYLFDTENGERIR
jgi:multiple sugar transport system ATP-binding protein